MIWHLVRKKLDFKSTKGFQQTEESLATIDEIEEEIKTLREERKKKEEEDERNAADDKKLMANQLDVEAEGEEEEDCSDKSDSDMPDSDSDADENAENVSPGNESEQSGLND